MRSLHPLQICTRGRVMPDLTSMTSKGLIGDIREEAYRDGGAVPLRMLTQEQALILLPYWVKQALQQNVRVLDRGNSIILILFKGAHHLLLDRRDYDRFVLLLTDDPTELGLFWFDEPLLTQWIAAAIREVFTRP